MSTEAFFQQLDAPLSKLSINANKNKNNEAIEPICWQTNDFLVQYQFELPIPIMAGSMVKYSFSTRGGDIQFSAFFFSHERKPEAIFQEARVPSDIESIEGSFKAQREGTLVLFFDNSFSWFTSKFLTYKIQLFQPAFTVADTARCTRSRHLLHAIVEDTRRAEVRLAKSQEKILTLRSEIPDLESRLEALELELGHKNAILHAALSETQEMGARITANLEKKNGLCIRCLSKSQMIIMMSFLGGTGSSASSVCKYWLLIARESSK